MEQRGKGWGGSLGPCAMDGGCPHLGSTRLQDSVSPSVKWLVKGHSQLGERRAARGGAGSGCHIFSQPPLPASARLCPPPASLRAGRGGARAAKAGPSPLARRELTRS